MMPTVSPGNWRNSLLCKRVPTSIRRYVSTPDIRSATAAWSGISEAQRHEGFGRFPPGPPTVRPWRTTRCPELGHCNLRVLRRCHQAFRDLPQFAQVVRHLIRWKPKWSSTPRSSPCDPGCRVPAHRSWSVADIRRFRRMPHPLRHHVVDRSDRRRTDEAPVHLIAGDRSGK